MSSRDLTPPVMETFLLSEPAIRPSRMSASVLRRKMTGMLSVRLDLVPEILLTLESRVLHTEVEVCNLML